MPTYDFRCKVCGHKWEAAQKMTDPNPKCKCGEEAEKVFNKAAPVHFHGGGWAKDGYK